MTQLDLIDNPVTFKVDYRDITLRLIEGLEILDTLAIEEYENLSDGGSCGYHPTIEEEDDNDTRVV